MSSAHEGPLLALEGLGVEFRVGRRRPAVRAVDGVSLSIAPQETLALVGESGSGKTTIGRAILGRAPIVEGSVRFAGADITHAPRPERRVLSKSLQVVFQNPYSSLNPARTVGQTLVEMLLPHGKPPKGEASAQARSMLERVGLGADAVDRYPSQFSGGQRQRIAIARALMVSPRLVVCDEPVSALDISVQAQILNLLHELQGALQLSYLFISHDIAVVRHVAHRIAVLYRGRIMEHGDADAVFARPAHPYTRTLLAAAPVPDPAEQRRKHGPVARGGLETAATPRDACPFAARCPHAVDECHLRRPVLETGPEGRLVACHRWRELPSPTLDSWRNHATCVPAS